MAPTDCMSYLQKRSKAYLLRVSPCVYGHRRVGNFNTGSYQERKLGCHSRWRLRARFITEFKALLETCWAYRSKRPKRLKWRKRCHQDHPPLDVRSYEQLKTQRAPRQENSGTQPSRTWIRSWIETVPPCTEIADKYWRCWIYYGNYR